MARLADLAQAVLGEQQPRMALGNALEQLLHGHPGLGRGAGGDLELPGGRGVDDGPALVEGLDRPGIPARRKRLEGTWTGSANGGEP